jgi:zinc protease
MRATTMLIAGGLAMTLAASAGAQERGKATAVLLPVPDDATIAFGVWFKVGSQNDPPGKEGLAYLTAQLISEGSTTKNAYEEILRKLYPMASGYGVRVDKEMTTLGGRTHRDNTAKYMELLSDAFLRPAFSQADFDRLKSDQINYLEKNLRYASDEELAKAALHGFVFDGTGYENIPQGTVAGLQSITLDDVKAFYQRYYTRDNAVVALGGGYSKDVQKQFEDAVKSLPAGRVATVPAPKPAAVRGQQVTLVAKPNADATICFGFPIDVHRGEKDFYALWVANSWLGEHRNSSSHLYQVIREARGLNYGDYSYIEAFPEGGFRRQPPTGVGRRQQIFEVWIRTLPNKHAHFALRAALREVKDLVDGGMTQEEFDLTRSFLSKYVLHFAETTTNRLGYAVDDQFYGVDGSHLAKFREAMKTLTLADVNAAIRKHLQYDNLKIAMVTGDAENMKQALVANTPSPMTYDNPKSDAIVAEDKEIAVFPLRVKAEDVKIVAVEEMFGK